MTQLATIQPKVSALAVMAGRFSVEPAKLLDTLKNTVFKGANDAELMTLVIVANEYSLNPLTKQIYAFPAKGGGIVPVVSIDGWVHVINSHPQMDGLDFEFRNDARGNLESCTCIIHRKDRTRPIRVTEYLSECKRTTEPWKMEHRMLRHKALIQAGRIAFGLSGIMDEDDAGRLEKPITGTTVDISPAKLPTRPKPAAAIEAPSDSPAPEPEPAPKKAAPIKAKATPLEGLKNLCMSSDIDEPALIEFLAPVRSEGVSASKLEHLTPDEIRNCVENWSTIVESIGGRA